MPPFYYLLGSEKMNLNTMSREELLEQAEILELDVAKNISTANLLAAVKREVGEDEEAEEEVDVSGFAQINFAKEEKNKRPVFFGLNGKSYRFERGVWCKCPKILLPTIKNAIKRVEDEDGEWSELPAYSYQLKGE